MDKKVLLVISCIIGILLAAMFLMFGLHYNPLSDCRELAGKFCKNKKTGYCETVYVARDSIFKECRNLNALVIQEVCDDPEARLFTAEKECIAPKASTSCPAGVKNITQDQVEKLYLCPSLQKDVCRQACGTRYDTIDVRNFYQTDRRPGILCEDPSEENLKNGVTLAADENRKACMEVHQGIFKWCTNYNKIVNTIDLGAFVQCQGRIE